MEKKKNQKSSKSIQIDEKKLIERAQSGDFVAFNTLIGDYQGKIYGLALKLAKNKEDAEDIFQETFLKAIDNIQQFRAESSFGTWLYTIAVNIVRARYGRSREKDLLSLEEYFPVHQHGEEADSSLLDWRDPLSKLTDAEVRQKLDTAIKALPLKYRMPFLLRYFEEMPIKEVAKTLGLSEAATKSRILRARLALRQDLNEYFKERIVS